MAVLPLAVAPWGRSRPVVPPLLPAPSEPFESALAVAEQMEVPVDLRGTVLFRLKTGRVKRYCHLRP